MSNPVRAIEEGELASQIDEIFDAVAAGAEIEILRRGRAVARLVPVSENDELAEN